MRLLIALILVVTAVPLEISAQCEPIEVVMAYCSLDSAGAKCHGIQIDTLSMLYDLSGEPGWDQSMVISEYELVQSHQSGDTAVVTILYNIVGWLDGGSLYLPGEKPYDHSPAVAKEEIVSFELTQHEDCWRIVAPLLMPHTSVANTISRIDSSLNGLGDNIDYDSLHPSIAGYVRNLEKTRRYLVDYRHSVSD
jgi:hypothetical protein